MRQVLLKVIYCTLLTALVTGLNYAQHLDVEGKAEIDDTLRINKNTTVPWGHEWINHSHDKIWMKQSWSGSTGDKLYLSSSGARDNNLQGGILMSESRISFGKGHDNGLQLNEEQLRLTTAGDLFLGGFNAHYAKPKMRIKRKNNNYSGLLIENADGGAHSWFPYSDGNIYLTGDRSGGNLGSLIFRSYINGNYYDHLRIHGPTGQAVFEDDIIVEEDIIGRNSLTIIHPPQSFYHGLKVVNEATSSESWIMNRANSVFDEQDSGLKFMFSRSNTTWVPRVLEEDGDWVSGSDRRLKKEIESIDKNQLKNINQLAPSQYKYKATKSDEIKFGFIAQDVAILYPNLVSKMVDGNFGINYEGFIPILTAGIQELSVENTTLKNQLMEQSKMISELVDRIEMLEEK